MGLVSIASNLDLGHNVKVVDCFKHETINAKRIIDDFKPKVIGLSCMSPQYEGAKNFATEIRKRYQDIIIVVGGYHPTLMHKEILNSDDKVLFDYIVRNEGEFAFNKLLQAIDGLCDFSEVPNLSYIRNGVPTYNETVESLDLSKIKLPDRRLISGNRYVAYSDVFSVFCEVASTFETSRGCTHNCNFCSIKKMYSKPYRAYALSRVIEDLKNIKKYQPDVVRLFFIDDNLTADPERFENLLDLIIENKLNTFKLFAQASCIGLSKSEKLVAKMKEAGFDTVFLGIENNDKKNLKYLRKGDILSHTETACKYLHKYELNIIGGMMIGLPDDDIKSVKSRFRYLKKLKIDFAGTQFVTPYPKTALREDYLKRNLVDIPDEYTYYDGTLPNVHTNYLTLNELFEIFEIEYIKFFLKVQTREFIKTFGLRAIFSMDIKSLAVHVFWRLMVMGGRRFAGDRYLKNLAYRYVKAKKDSEAGRFFEDGVRAGKIKARQVADETHGAVTIDLKPYINTRMEESPMSWYRNNANSLFEMPVGKNVYAGVPFDVEGSIQLMGGSLRQFGKRYPSRVVIPVRRKCSKIYLLHGNACVQFKHFGTIVAKVVLNYEDGSTRKMNMVAGRQAFDWWFPSYADKTPESWRTPAPDTEVAWVGSNLDIWKRRPECSLCLFKTSFDNPRAGVTISSLEYISTKTITSPFLVALTVE